MALYESLTAQSTPEQIAAAYKEFLGNGGDTAQTQQAATNYLTGLGISQPTIGQAYQQYLNPTTTGAASDSTPLYQSLNTQSTPEQIAAAYKEFVGTGGETAQSKQTAANYLTGLGITEPTIEQAYQQYLSPTTTGATTGTTTGGATDTTGATTGGVTTGTTTGGTTGDATTSAFDKSLGVFQKVYDPATGREFMSPLEALYAGVTDYTTTRPTNIALTGSDQAAIDAWMAAHPGGTREQALAGISGKYGMTPEQFANYEIQGNLKSQRQQDLFGKIAEYDALPMDQVLAKLQAYKENPPTTEQELADQQAAWRSYDKVYHTAAWNDPRIVNKSQDYSLQPKARQAQFTGYAEPLNKYLSGIAQNTPDFTRLQNQLTKHPEIAEAIKNVYGADPNAMLFTGNAGDLSPAIIHLGGEIERIGAPAALRNFYQQQQGLVGIGGPDWFGSQTMGNKAFADLQKVARETEPKVSDALWEFNTRKINSGRNDALGAFTRDTDSGAGLAGRFDANGNLTGVSVVGRSGKEASTPASRYANNLPELLQFADVSLNTVQQFVSNLEKQGVKVPDYLKEFGQTLLTQASDSWLDEQIAQRASQDEWARKAGFSPTSDAAKQKQISDLKEINAAAKRQIVSMPAEDIAGYIDKTINPQDNKLTDDQKTVVTDYLKKAGASKDFIDNALKEYEKTYSSGLADKVFSAFENNNVGSAPSASGILSGFAAINNGDITKEEAKDVLGDARYKQYENQLGSQIADYTKGILSDGSLSGQEALDTIQQARKLGLDADKFSEMTGYSKDLYNKIESGYENTVKGIVNSALADKSDADKLKTGLALESKYGFSDEDLAKATGYDTKQIKNWYDPVRNFGEEYKNALSKPDVSGKDILGFLDKAKESPTVGLLYGDKIGTFEDKINELNDKWKGYNVDGYQAENVYNQVKGLTDKLGGKNWSGSWGGGGDNAMKSTAQKLVERGVDNLGDLKVVRGKDEQTEEGPVPRYNLIDASSGKVISTSGSDKNFVLDSYETGNFLKSTDKTMGIMMTDSGVPVPYQTSEKGGLVTSPVFPILMSALLPGVGSAISGALSGAVGTGLANAALTQGIMSGGMAALTGGDVGKSFVGGAIGAPIAAGISSILPTGMDPNAAKFATNVGTNLARGAIMGTPSNLAGSLINAGLQYGGSQLPLNLTPQQVNLLAGIATPLLQGQSINPTQLAGILANYGMKSQQAQKGAQ